MGPLSRPWWGLSARQTVALFAVAVLIGVGIALVVGPGGGGEGDAPPKAAVERVRPGSTGSPDAVWVFGFETLRFDPLLRRGGQLAVQGFGDVVGGPGAVYLYDAGSGRVGVLDAATNTLRAAPSVDGRIAGTNQDLTFVPTLAPVGTSVWVAPDPGTVVPVDPVTGAAGDPIDVSPGSSGSSASSGSTRATGVVASAAGVFAGTRTADGVDLARVDPTTGAVTTASVAGATLDGLAVDRTALWLRSGRRLHELDPGTLDPVRTVEVPPDRAGAGLGGLVVADDDVWMLADGGASLLRYDPERDRFGRAARLLDRRPDAVETPAALVTDGRRVVAMVRRAGAARPAVRLVAHDARSGRTRGVDVPGRLAAGAAALSTRAATGGSG